MDSVQLLRSTSRDPDFLVKYILHGHACEFIAATAKVMAQAPSSSGWDSTSSIRGPLPIAIILWNDLPDLAVAFYCIDIKLSDRRFSLGG